MCDLFSFRIIVRLNGRFVKINGPRLKVYGLLVVVQPRDRLWVTIESWQISVYQRPSTFCLKIVCFQLKDRLFLETVYFWHTHESWFYSFERLKVLWLAVNGCLKCMVFKNLKYTVFSLKVHSAEMNTGLLKGKNL